MIKSIALLAALAVTSAAFASPPKPAAAAPKKLHCCVMPEDEVNIAEATKAHRFIDYKGNRYYFCCMDCYASFKKDPAKYLKGDHTKTPPAHH